jgi:hypothetical protein
MADVKPPPGPPEYAMPVPAGVPASEKELYIQLTPVWVVVLRGFQIFVSLPILIMAAILIHGVSLSANAFAVACVRALACQASQVPLDHDGLDPASIPPRPALPLAD